MRKAVMILSAVLAVLMLASAAGCTSPVLPEVSHTDEPAVTDEAPVITEEPTEAPTEEPTEEPSEEYYAVIEPGEPFILDMDGDGLDDNVLLTVTEKEYDIDFTVEITLGADPDKTFSKTVKHANGVNAAAIDSVPGDGRREIVVCYDCDSDDYSSLAYRVKDDGSGIEEFEDWFAVRLPKDCDFDHEIGLEAYFRTDILGTHDVEGTVIVTADGFEVTSDCFRYPEYEDGWGKLTLTKDIELDLVNEDGTVGEKIVVPAGETIAPYTTDLETYVTMKLDDGRVCRADVTVKTGDEWGIYLNGVLQDEYAQIPYAD